MGLDQPPRIRPRAAADLPALGRVLEQQQPHTGYPHSWPLRYPVEQFIARRGELGAWVATLDDDPAPIGHVSVTAPATGANSGADHRVEASPEVEGWVAGTGLPVEQLAAVSVLYVDHTVSGRGVGGALLDTAVGFIRSSGRTPVLDVVQETTRAVRLYRRSGWQVVGEARPWWLPADHLPVLLMALPDGVDGVEATDLIGGSVDGAQARTTK